MKILMNFWQSVALQLQWSKVRLMNNELLSTMRRDMNIMRYDGEPQDYYVGRILYSALAQWMRYIVLDETTQNSDRKSKTYVLTRMRKILNSMSDAVPLSKGWFFTDKNSAVDVDELIRHLRDKMLAAGELMEVDEQRNLGLPQRKIEECVSGYLRVFGLSQDILKFQHVGITRVFQDPVVNEKQDKIAIIPEIDGYLSWIFKTANWIECKNVETMEFFNPFSKKPSYQSWTSNMNKSENRQLARITLYKGLHEYYLVKREKDKVFSSSLVETLSDYKEERRILLGLRKSVNNSMNARYVVKEPVVILKLYCGLPLREQAYLDTYCWPLNCMEDKYNFVVPKFIWNYVCKMLNNNLGLELVEEN